MFRREGPDFVTYDRIGSKLALTDTSGSDYSTVNASNKRRWNAIPIRMRRVSLPGSTIRQGSEATAA